VIQHCGRGHPEHATTLPRLWATILVRLTLEIFNINVFNILHFARKSAGKYSAQTAPDILAHMMHLPR
jgi:hypothetical protein